MGSPRNPRRRSLVILTVAVVVTAVVAGAELSARRLDQDEGRHTGAERSADVTNSELGDVAPIAMPSTSRRAALATTSTMAYQFPQEWVGDVWVSVTTARADGLNVVLVWGSWQRTLAVRGAVTTVYRFRKAWTASDAPSPPVVVVSEGRVGLTFGYGAPPAGSIDANEGWVPAEPGPGTSLP